MTSLIDRYVAATHDGFPNADQAEVEREVRAALNDMVEARITQGISREQAEQDAVEELGDPVAFAQQFRKSQRYLIGPKLFGSWWFLLRTLLMIVTPIVMAISLLESLASDGVSYGEAIAQAIGSGFGFAIQVAFWLTLTYAIFEILGINPGIEGALSKADWSVEDLPELESGRQIGKMDLVLQVVPLSLFVWFISRLATEGLGAFGLNQWLDLSSDVPVFNPDLSEVWFWGVVGLVVMSLLAALWSFAVGCWTQTVTLVNILVGVAWIGFFVALSSVNDIINPEIQQLRPDLGTWSIVGERSNRIIVSIVIIVTLIDLWDSVKGHLEFRRRMKREASSLME